MNKNKKIVIGSLFLIVVFQCSVPRTNPHAYVYQGILQSNASTSYSKKHTHTELRLPHIFA
jgi:hypothetical protein